MPELKEVGLTVEFDFEVVQAAEIAAVIRSIDATGTAQFLPSDENIGLKAIRDWATKDIIAQRDTKFKGRTFKKGQKIRSAIANSLEEYMTASTEAEKFIWRTVMDSNTGDLDRELDGQEYPYADAASPIPPLHPNCRCTREPIQANPETYKSSILS